MIRLLTCCWLILGLVVTSFAQEDLSLEGCYALALENNFQIKIDEANIKLATHNDSWARTGKYPTIDLNGTFNVNLVTDNNPASFLRGTYFAGGIGPSVDLQWLVFGGGRVGILKEQLSTLTLQQIAAASINVQEILRQVTLSYHNVLLQQEQLAVLQEVFRLSQDRLEYEEARQEFGASSSFQLLQFEEAVIADSTNVIRQRQAWQTAKRNLFALLLVDLSSPYEFSDRLSVVPEELDRSSLQTALSEDNPTIRSLIVAHQLDEINARLEETNKKPSFAFGASIGWTENYFKFFADDPNTGDQFPGVFSNRLNLGANASIGWNLYDGGLIKENIESAKMQAEIGQLEILRAEADLVNQLDILVENYRDELVLLELSDDQIRVSQDNLSISEERFRLGQINSFDYRAVQNQYLNAAFNKVNAIYNLLTTKTEIDWLVGAFND